MLAAMVAILTIETQIYIILYCQQTLASTIQINTRRRQMTTHTMPVLISLY
jgi:hypothetical protein